MSRSRNIAMVALGALLVASCSGGDGDEADEPASTDSVAESDDGPFTTSQTDVTESDDEPDGGDDTFISTDELDEPTGVEDVNARQPLTGRPVPGEADIEQGPALAVVIDNGPGARFVQTGLGLADIVYETVVEGGITRLIAVFHDQAESVAVGPIRSGRSQDVALLAPLNEPLFAWSGGNPGVNDLIAAAPVVDLNALDVPEPYERSGDSPPSNLFSETGSLVALTPDDHPGPPPQQFVYRTDAEPFGGAALAGFSLLIGSNPVSWDWDEGTGAWLRWQEGEPHFDSTFGRLAAANVVVMVVDYGRSVIDTNTPEAITVGDGAVLVFSGGRVVEGRWSRDNAAAAFTLTGADGEPIALAPGTTWVELAAGIDTGDPDRPAIPVWYDRG